MDAEELPAGVIWPVKPPDVETYPAAELGPTLSVVLPSVTATLGRGSIVLCGLAPSVTLPGT